MGKLYRIVSFTYHLASDLALDLAVFALHKIEKAFKPKPKERYYDSIHDDD
jgi:hypothetical protein